MSQLASVLNRTIQVSDLEGRVSRLEERMPQGALGVSVEVAPEAETAAPADIGDEASVPNGSATQEKAEAINEDTYSGSEMPERAKE